MHVANQAIVFDWEVSSRLSATGLAVNITSTRHDFVRVVSLVIGVSRSGMIKNKVQLVRCGGGVIVKRKLPSYLRTLQCV